MQASFLWHVSLKFQINISTSLWRNRLLQFKYSIYDNTYFKSAYSSLFSQAECYFN